MRLLHTSDWHLGQHFMGKSRQAEHQALIDWLLTQVEAQHVDAVLIAGDIFDTGTPPSYARELYNQLVVRLPRTARTTGDHHRDSHGRSDHRRHTTQHRTPLPLIGPFS